MWCFVSLFLVVSTSAINCLERLVSEMTYYVSSGTLNTTHSLTHWLALYIVLTCAVADGRNASDSRRNASCRCTPSDTETVAGAETTAGTAAATATSHDTYWPVIVMIMIISDGQITNQISVPNAFKSFCQIWKQLWNHNKAFIDVRLCPGIATPLVVVG